MRPTEQPVITDLRVTERGYRARALCVIDEYPGDITILVDTTAAARSRYSVAVFDPMSLSWRSILRATGPDYPPLPDDPTAGETLAAVRVLVDHLHTTAVWISRTAHNMRPRH
ncbi:hypothetical protein OHB12_11665 [Nocardia sp. NBC_01730]|uniref:hypothetical protein n=1 Tax=Nocardia sp. NBC_01730 TaxID=2975998 RepID=UPI002E14D3DB|nr:hypothetical protein OHB12_11665 [Nocardia sp. NBC_01730]